jgi:acyl transferase domain-containing protein
MYAARTADANEPRGMMAIGLGPEQAEQYLNMLRARYSNLKRSIVCVNSVSNVTIAGLAEHLQALRETLDTQSVFAQRLKVDVAYHSPYVIAVAEKYRAAISRMVRREVLFKISYEGSLF